MRTLLEPIYAVLLYVIVDAGNKAISAAMAKDGIRAVCYGLVALIALIVVILACFGVR